MKFAVFLPLLVLVCGGEALKCPSCFSRISEEDCNWNAKLKTCSEAQTLCLLYKSTSTKAGSLFLRYCASESMYVALNTGCTQVKIRNHTTLGDVFCRAYSCPFDNCFAGSSNILSARTNWRCLHLRHKLHLFPRRVCNVLLEISQSKREL